MLQALNKFFPLLIILLLIGCKDDKTDPTTTLTNTACSIDTETTALTGNQASWKYEYVSGTLTKITRFNSVGGVVATTDITSTALKVTQANGALAEYAYDADIFNGTPSRVDISVTIDGVKRSNYYTYLFTYDGSKRLIKVSEHTPTVMGDGEWDLDITYNAQNNVTQLQYVWTDGMITIVPPITINAYDDKPTPYAAIPGWKFMMSNFAWDNYDPEPVLTALSSNNPLDYTLGSGTSAYIRSMSYTYNDKNFPLQRTNTNKNSNGEYTFVQAMTYQCK